jgi:hypothetical protein
MTLVEALAQASAQIDRFLASMTKTQRGITRTRTRKFIIGAPANLADIIRDAEVHRTFLGFGAMDPQRFRALGPPGVLPGQPHPEITRAIFEALFHPQSLNRPTQSLNVPVHRAGVVPPRRLT